MAKEKRSYNQFCSLARALDIVGHRWTLLLIRELLTGPKRFKDLEVGLKGMGTNLLAERLKQLEADGLIRQITLPPPASVPAYELTDVGRDLEPAVIALASWGTQFRTEKRPDDHWLPRWNALAFKAVFNPDTAGGIDDVYEVEVDGESTSIRVRDGRIETSPDARWEPDLKIEAAEDAFVRLVTGEIDMDEAMRTGEIKAYGKADALRRFLRVFGPSISE